MEFDKEYYLKFGHKKDNISLILNNIDIINQSNNVLVAPAGFGEVSRFLIPRCKKVKSIDISDFQVSLSGGVVQKGDIKDFKYDDKFDLIICKDLLEHLNENDIDKSIINIRELLSDNGKAIIGVGTKSLNCFWDDPTHQTYQTERWWIEKFLSFGFYINQFSKTFGEFVFDKKQKKFNPLKSKIFKNENSELFNIEKDNLIIHSLVKENRVYLDLKINYLNDLYIDKNFVSIPIDTDNFSLFFNCDFTIVFKNSNEETILMTDKILNKRNMSMALLL